MRSSNVQAGLQVLQLKRHVCALAVYEVRVSEHCDHLDGKVAVASALHWVFVLWAFFGGSEFHDHIPSLRDCCTCVHFWKHWVLNRCYDCGDRLVEQSWDGPIGLSIRERTAVCWQMREEVLAHSGSKAQDATPPACQLVGGGTVGLHVLADRS